MFIKQTGVLNLLSPETEKECGNVKMFLNEQKRIFHWRCQKEKTASVMPERKNSRKHNGCKTKILKCH